MISKRYMDWWQSNILADKIRIIKDKAIEVNKAHKRMLKANHREMEYGLNRTGLRGGKFTTLAANSQRITESYLDAIEELKYMVKTL